MVHRARPPRRRPLRARRRPRRAQGRTAPRRRVRGVGGRGRPAREASARCGGGRPRAGAAPGDGRVGGEGRGAEGPGEEGRGREGLYAGEGRVEEVVRGCVGQEEAEVGGQQDRGEEEGGARVCVLSPSDSLGLRRPCVRLADRVAVSQSGCRRRGKSFATRSWSPRCRCNRFRCVCPSSRSSMRPNRD